jgi:hypothetical protein
VAWYLMGGQKKKILKNIYSSNWLNASMIYCRRTNEWQMWMMITPRWPMRDTSSVSSISDGWNKKDNNTCYVTFCIVKLTSFYYAYCYSKIFYKLIFHWITIDLL